MNSCQLTQRNDYVHSLQLNFRGTVQQQNFKKLQTQQKIDVQLRNFKQQAQGQGQGGSLGDEEFEVGVFRFTLNLPFLPDKLIPRFIGILNIGLIAANHFTTQNTMQTPQKFSEGLGLFLASLLIVAPALEQRLLEMQSSSGRNNKKLNQMDKNQQVFYMQDGLNEKDKVELAWSSFALVQNTNTSLIMYIQFPNMALGLLRGITDQILDSKDKKQTYYQRTQQNLGGLKGQLQRLVQDNFSSQNRAQIYFPDKLSLISSSYGISTLIPSNIQSVLICPAYTSQQVYSTNTVYRNRDTDYSTKQSSNEIKGLLIAMADESRILSNKEKAWIQSLAQKLSTLEIA